MSSRIAGGLAARPADTLAAVLRPSSIAVVGASADPTKRGHRALLALRSAGFRGRIIPVNPAGGELLGYAVARGPHELDAPVDLALVCTPARTVPAVLADWARAGARGAVVLASGFGESGDEGALLEDAIRDVVAATGMRVIGPNTSGFLNVPAGVNLIGVDGVAAGDIGLLVQSGNLALALITEAARTGVGFSFVIGVGNEVDIGFHEYLDFLAADEATRAIAVHAEGFRHGAAFLAAVRRARAAKPIAVLKGGRSAAGGNAVRSHTGAVAGSYAALRAGLRQAGAVEVRRTDELLPVLATLRGAAGRMRPGGVAILSDGGGHATLAVDDLHERGIRPAHPGPGTSGRLRALLGPAAAVTNPIDLAGAADRDPLVFARALELVAADEGTGVVLVLGLFGGYAIRFSESLLASEIEAAHRLARIAAEANVPLVVHSLYARTGSEPLQVLQRAGVPVVESLETACRCVQALLEHRAGAPGRNGSVSAWPAGLDDGGAVDAASFQRARADGRAALLETEARALVERFGVPLVPAEACVEAGAIARAAARFGCPVAVRVVAPGAPHKTEAGGVALHVPPTEAAATGARLTHAVSAWCAANGRRADVRGVLVSPMLAAPVVELLVGVVRDPQFGPVLTLGVGGTRVELEQDVATRVLPVDAADIDDMLASLRIAPILAGYRGARAADLASLRHTVLAIARCALACADIAEIEINPLFVYADRAVAVDVRVFLT